MPLGELRFSKLSLLAVFFTVLFFLPAPVKAASPYSLLVDVSPENPAPGENVNISLNSYANDLDSVLITWSLNGKKVSSGVGLKTFSAVAPAAGAETRVTADVALPDGALQKVIVIRPNIMVLLWQADDSYVPPFYKGKALPTPDSEVKVVAMPEVKSGTETVSPKNMVYAWRKDYTNDAGASGYGKNFYIYTNDYLDDSNNISVTASTTDQKYSAEASMDIRTYEPKILFYKNDAVLGALWERALQDGHTIDSQEIIIAAPYFISPKNLRIPSLEWQWSINDVFVAVSPLSKNMLPVAVTGGVSGTSTIKLKISNKFKLFEDAAAELSVKF